VTTAVDRLDRWIRNEFVEYNTVLEEAYFAERREIIHHRAEWEKVKQAVAAEGGDLIGAVSAAGPLPVDAREKYQLLGMVGFYLAACRRHESAGPAESAWSLARLLGSALGVAPRFVFAHQALYNPAVRDRYQTFTSLADEAVFLTNNGLAVLAYQRAADALRRVPPMGVSNPLTAYLLETALSALEDVLQFNQTLGKTLDADRFFFNIRPYFKSHRVGAVEYRGANAGDFSAINEIDLLLGLCDARDPFYQNVIAEKYAYVAPEDQVLLRAVVDEESLLAKFLREVESGAGPQLRQNAELFLAVCRAHGAAYTYHHHRLVKPFLVVPAEKAPADRLTEITASGPPLDVVVAGLSRLSDLRSARDRAGTPTARPALERLRALVSGGPVSSERYCAVRY
jgi:hypothetical protein